MNNWKETTLGEIGVSLKHGFAFDSKELNTEGNFPVIRIGNIQNGEISNLEIKYSGNNLEELDGYLVENGDLIMSLTGGDESNLSTATGRVGILRCGPALLNQRVAKIIVPDDVSRDFLFYYLSQKSITKHLASTANGSVQRNLTNGHIARLSLLLPPLEEQEKIAGILGSLDDKIELLRKENETLEKLAQTLFKRWFVDFEFPADSTLRNQAGGSVSSASPAKGREGGSVRGYKLSGGKMIDSKLGPIPEGWRVGRFTDIADILGGGTPKTDRKEYWDGNIPFFTPKDANGIYCFGTEKTLTESGLKACNSKLYPKNTVFITARGTVGKCALAGQDMAMNQSCYALVGKEVSNQYVFLALRRSLRLITGYASGGVFDAITTSTFESMDIVIPDTRSVKRFSEAVSPVFEKIFQNSQQMTELAHLRDTLLPRLMSGNIDL